MNTGDEPASVPDPELSSAEREYVRAHSGLVDPFGGTSDDYERLIKETRQRIASTRMSVAEVAHLLGMDQERLRESVEDPDLVGLVMHTPQADLRESATGPSVTPLEWLAAGGDPQAVWDILTHELLW